MRRAPCRHAIVLRTRRRTSPASLPHALCRGDAQPGHGGRSGPMPAVAGEANDGTPLTAAIQARWLCKEPSAPAQAPAERHAAFLVQRVLGQRRARRLPTSRTFAPPACTGSPCSTRPRSPRSRAHRRGNACATAPSRRPTPGAPPSPTASRSCRDGSSYGSTWNDDGKRRPVRKRFATSRPSRRTRAAGARSERALASPRRTRAEGPGGGRGSRGARPGAAGMRLRRRRLFLLHHATQHEAYREPA